MRVARICFVVCAILCSVLCKAQVFADFTMDKAGGCSPVTINFTNLSTASANAKYSWDLGNGNMSTLKNPAAIYLKEKTYTITLTVSDGNQSSTRSKTITVYKKPFVDFSSASAKVCLPIAAQFTSTSTAGDGFINTYQWDFGDGTTQQGYGNQMSHSYYSEQIVTVSLTVTNNYGCQASVTKPNIVEVLPKIDPQFTVDKSMLCSLDESIQLTNNSTGPGTLIYNWNFGDGSTSSQKNPVYQFTKKGVYSVNLTVSNTDGCSATGFTTSVNAAYFNTDFTNQALCRQINFSSSSYLYPSNSVWQFGDGSSINSFYNTNHTYTAAGTYNVTLTNTYNNTCKETVTKTITVEDGVNFNSDIVMPSSVCQGNSVNFTQKSNATPGLLSWNFGDGYSYSTTYNSVSHVYNQPGTYTIKLVNTFGTCSETVTKNIVVNPVPNPQGFVVDYGGVCGAPVTVKFKDTTAGATAWQWQMNWSGNSFSTQQNPSYTFVNDGYYTVYLNVSNVYGCSRGTSKSVNVFKPSTNIYHTYSSSPRGNYDCDSITIKLAVNSNQTIKSYYWDLANGETSTEETPQVHYNKEGIYNVSLRYVTESGCSGTLFYTVRVYGKPKADFRYTVPCGNSLNLQFADNSFFSDYWRWSFGDVAEDYYSTPIHYYSDTGKYMVRFINHIGHCADTTYKEVYANVLPSSITITKAQNTCDGTRGEVTFDQRSLRASGGMWDFGDGITMPYDSSAHVIKHTYTSTGNYLVRLTSYYNGCTLVSTLAIRILLKQTPLLTASPNQICANGSVSIQISNLQTNPYTGNIEYGQYSIDKLEYNDGTPFTGSGNDYYMWRYTNFNSTLRNFSAGTSQFRAIVRNGNNTCVDTSNLVNVLVNGPKPGFKIQSVDLCYKSEFVFTDTSKSSTVTALNNWFWDFGDGTTQTSNSSSIVRHLYKNPGSYTVRLTVTDISGCSASYARTVNARGAKASFTASGLYVPNVPLNTTINFYNNSVSSNGTIDYKWIYGDGASSTNYTGSHTYTEAGTYTVYLIATDAATSCSDTAKQIITVKDFQTAFAFSTSFIGTNFCPPVMLRINNLSVGYYRLQWDFGDGTSSVQSYPTHIYYKPGVYKITLTMYGYNGLSGTYIDSIEIKQPSAQIFADILKGCTSQIVNLQSTSSNTNTYTWDFGDGVVTSGATALSHAYTYAGLYNPKLITKDNNSCSASTELPEKIIIDSLNIAIKGIPPLVCDSALIHFTPDVYNFAESKLGTPLTYKWDFGTGNAADVSNVKNPSFRYNVPGIYKVKFTVTSQYGCSKTAEADVVVNEKALGTITAANEVCEEGSVQFAGSAKPTGNLQWNWNFANGNTSSQQNPSSQTYTKAGTYSISMIVNKNGCLDTATHTLTVNAKPSINASPKQQVVCFGDSIKLTSTGGGTYLWYPSTGLNNTDIASPTASPIASTKYKVQVTSDRGCINNDSVFLTVAPRIKVQLLATADLCLGSTLQLNATGASAYQWINTTSGLSNTLVPNPILNIQNTGTYTVVGSDSYNCFKDTASILVTVRNRPTVNAGPDVTIVGGVPYQLNASSSNDVASWAWSPGNYLSCTNCAMPVATPKMQTAYVVKVTNSWGCAAYDTVTLKLLCAIGNVHIPNAFTPNNNGNNDIFYAKGSGVNIIKHFRIYNRWGQVVFERNNIGIDDRSAGWDGKYKGQYVDAGTYVYMAEMECISGEVFTFKGTVTVIK